MPMFPLLPSFIRAFRALRDQSGGVGGTVLAVIIVIGIVIAAVIALLIPD